MSLTSVAVGVCALLTVLPALAAVGLAVKAMQDAGGY
jgi:hypothetical protein